MRGPKKRNQTADIAYLAGEVHALVTFAQALSCALTVGQGVRTHFQVAEQVGLGNIEGLPVSERAIEGYQFAVKQILHALANPVRIE